MPSQYGTRETGAQSRSLAYGAIAQGFHWLTVVLVVAQCWLGIAAHGLPISPARLALLAWHKSLGLSILALVLLRLAWRQLSPPPPLPDGMPAAERVAAQLSHGLLYLLLMMLPLLGWLSSSAAGLTVSIYGWFELPTLIGADRSLARLLVDVHIVLAWTLLALIGVHVAAALRHHFILRDGVMLQMLPRQCRSGGETS
jgi:cytochrome b561